MQAVSKMREEVGTLRLEVDRLENVNVKPLEKNKNLKEEVDMERGKGLEKDSGSSQEHIAKPEVDLTSSGSGPEVDPGRNWEASGAIHSLATHHPVDRGMIPHSVATSRRGNDSP